MHFVFNAKLEVSCDAVIENKCIPSPPKPYASYIIPALLTESVLPCPHILHHPAWRGLSPGLTSLLLPPPARPAPGLILLVEASDLGDQKYTPEGPLHHTLQPVNPLILHCFRSPCSSSNHRAPRSPSPSADSVTFDSTEEIKASTQKCPLFSGTDSAHVSLLFPGHRRGLPDQARHSLEGFYTGHTISPLPCHPLSPLPAGRCLPVYKTAPAVSLVAS